MRAIRINGSIGHATVSLEEVAVPKPAKGEALVRVYATAATPGELEWSTTWQTQKGAPRLQAIPGHEFSGVIEQVGPDTEGFEEGDAVYGLNGWFSDGAAAEFCLTTPAEIASKPATIDHVQAAVVPISGLTAWQALFDHGKLTAGQKVLIHGGAGGVGSFAVQLAVLTGAFVATTVSGANIEFARSLGASQVIDYQKTKFEEQVKDADLVLDLAGGDIFHRSFRAIREGGKVVTVATSSESTNDPKVKAAFFIVEANRTQLTELARLIDAGILRPIVSEVVPIADAAKVLLTSKKAKPGKVVLRVQTE
jgi:NADPH:quinone reductase-like Zn-dependent oxidoreductase